MSIFGNLFKAAVGVVTLPVAAVVDAAEFVGVIPDSKENHTGDAMNSIVVNLKDAVSADKH